MLPDSIMFECFRLLCSCFLCCYECGRLKRYETPTRLRSSSWSNFNLSTEGTADLATVVRFGKDILSAVTMSATTPTAVATPAWINDTTG